MSSGDDPAAGHQDVGAAGVDHELPHAGEERHVGAGEDREADDVHVLLDGGRRDHLGRLMQTGVHHFHAGVAERGGDDLRAAIMAVEAGLGDQHANRARRSQECPPLSRSSANTTRESYRRQSGPGTAPSGTNSTASIPAARAPTTSTSYRSPT